VESEGHEEKYRAAIKVEYPQMNRSAKDGKRSSLHYGGEGVTHPPIEPGCMRAARYGRFERDPRRTRRVLEKSQDKRPYKRRAKWVAMLDELSDSRVVLEALRKECDPEKQDSMVSWGRRLTNVVGKRKEVSE